MKTKVIVTVMLAALMSFAVISCTKNEETTAEKTKEETTFSAGYTETDEILGEEITLPDD